jgi:tRNA(fMet)-specific endonuclease VapC
MYTKNSYGKSPEPALLQVLIEQIPVLAFDEAAAYAYAMLPFKRGNFDRLVSAHALSLGLTLISRNVKDFADVSGLEIENWTI